MDLFDNTAAKRVPNGNCWGCGSACFKGEFHSCPPKPMARATDPESSHEAARRHVTSGKADAHCRIVLEAMKAHQGRTSAELAVITGLERHEVARRCSDLKNSGLAFQGEQRVCGVSGKQAVTWWVKGGRDA